MFSSSLLTSTLHNILSKPLAAVIGTNIGRAGNQTRNLRNRIKLETLIFCSLLAITALKLPYLNHIPPTIYFVLWSYEEDYFYVYLAFIGLDKVQQAILTSKEDHVVSTIGDVLSTTSPLLIGLIINWRWPVL